MNAFFDRAHLIPTSIAITKMSLPITKAGKRWTPTAIIEELKPKAKAPPGCGTCSCPTRSSVPELNNLEYAPLAEITGRVHWSPEVFNCSRT